MYFIYILTNHTNNVFYVGVTHDITKRVFYHRKGINKDSFSSRYRLYKLIFVKGFESVIEAIKWEKKIKGWTREKKMRLIKEYNKEFKNLY